MYIAYTFYSLFSRGRTFTTSILILFFLTGSPEKHLEIHLLAKVQKVWSENCDPSAYQQMDGFGRDQVHYEFGLLGNFLILEKLMSSI